MRRGERLATFGSYGTYGWARLIKMRRLFGLSP